MTAPSPAMATLTHSLDSAVDAYYDLTDQLFVLVALIVSAVFDGFVWHHQMRVLVQINQTANGTQSECI